ncbi:hypothetical protein CGT95_05850 [Vibrio metoecus]|nr:hypothetical protein CGT95_05850 [Vibrio metoecus]
MLDYLMIAVCLRNDIPVESPPFRIVLEHTAMYLRGKAIFLQQSKTKPNSKELGLTFDYSKQPRVTGHFE